tara:strand:- start:1599 stop:1799 length:201 start_codon:yes stop_codon:yes gene_type:complete
MELYTNPKHWEVLLNNKVFTSCDTLQSKEDCIRHIENMLTHKIGVDGKWSYRELVEVTRIRKTCEY